MINHKLLLSCGLNGKLLLEGSLDLDKISKVDMSNYQPFFLHNDFERYGINLHLDDKMFYYTPSHLEAHKEEYKKCKMMIRDFIYEKTKVQIGVKFFDFFSYRIQTMLTVIWQFFESLAQPPKKNATVDISSTLRGFQCVSGARGVRTDMGSHLKHNSPF